MLIPPRLRSKALALAAKPAVWAIVVALLLIGAIWLGNALTGGKRAQTEAELNANRGDAAIESGRDAVNTVGNRAAAEDAIDRTTQENSDAIRSAEGADDRVNPSVHNAGVDGLCKRPAYRDTQFCLQRADP